MYAKTEQHCFYILLSGVFARPSQHSISLPPLPFYLLRLPKADTVISKAFNSLSHPLAAPLFRSCLPSPCWVHSLQFPIPAGRRMSNLDNCGEKYGGTNTRVRMMEGKRKHMRERLRGAAAIRLFLFFFLLLPKLTLLIFLT